MCITLYSGKMKVNKAAIYMQTVSRKNPAKDVEALQS